MGCLEEILCGHNLEGGGVVRSWSFRCAGCANILTVITRYKATAESIAQNQEGWRKHGRKWYGPRCEPPAIAAEEPQHA